MNEWKPASDFQQAACPKHAATVLLDDDVLDWIKSEFADWQGHINDLLRFHMDTSQSHERNFAPDPPAPATPEF